MYGMHHWCPWLQSENKKWYSYSHTGIHTLPPPTPTLTIRSPSTSHHIDQHLIGASDRVWGGSKAPVCHWTNPGCPLLVASSRDTSTDKMEHLYPGPNMTLLSADMHTTWGTSQIAYMYSKHKSQTPFKQFTPLYCVMSLKSTCNIAQLQWIVSTVSEIIWIYCASCVLALWVG